MEVNTEEEILIVSNQSLTPDWLAASVDLVF